MINRQFEIKLADTEELQEKAFKIREEVFVVEQRVDKREEFDEFENSARHFVVLDRNGDPIGASRWRRTDNGIKMERFAVKESLRGTGIGQALVQATLDDIKEEAGTGNMLYMHAQLPAVSLYARFGFQKVGDQFSECDILHYKMQLIN